MRSEVNMEDPSRLSDTELTAEVARLTWRAREATTSLIAHLAEFDARRLYLGAGFSSLFIYCREVLRLSEHEAYNRIEAARLARRFPAVVDRLGEGALNLTTVRLLAPHLTPENHEELMAAAAGKTKHEVEEVIACYFPRPDVPSSVRKVPAPRATPSLPDDRVGCTARAGQSEATKHPGVVCAPESTTGAHRPEVLRPLAPERYEIRFTASAEICEKLRLAKDLLRHAKPDVDIADVVDRAVTVLLEGLARKKFAATARPRQGREAPNGGAQVTRHTPAAVKRTVWRRDGGRCAFLGTGGRRCNERGFLEFHHVRPYGIGGEATVDNIEIRCRRHNAYEADLFYGRLVPERVGGPEAGAVPRR